jgi:LssY C-terminus
VAVGFLRLTEDGAKRLVRLSLLLLLAYLAVSYVLMPGLWRLAARRHPALDSTPTCSSTAAGIVGDPLNVAFVGSEAQLHRSLLEAGWSPADPVTLRTSLRIVAASALHRSYESAPVSSLYVWGRVQDFAFEEQAGSDPRQRHHVRFWRSAQVDALGRPLWIGAATFDTRVGFSHTTGQVTHHIGPGVDLERDKLVSELGRGAGMEVSWIDGFHPERTGHNGGGDPYWTDGRLAVLTAPAARE